MKIKITLLFYLFSLSIVAQSITAKLIDKSSRKPIPYANIKTGKYSGVISNDEGFFTISSTKDNKSITISCIGYENKSLTIEDIKALNFVIELQESINKLDEVFISNKALNADSIIAKVKAKLTDNYSNDLQQYNMFKRTTDHVDFKNLEFEIDKASHVKKKQLQDVNNSLTALVKQVKNSNMIQFSDVKGKIFTLNKDSIKLEIEKATELLDYKNDFSIDNIQEKMQNIILTYLDTTKTYKLKTGLFKIEDSLSLNDDNFKENNENQYTLDYLNSSIKSLLKRAQLYNGAFLSKLLNTDLYEYKFQDVGYNNGEPVYIISYVPKKGKSKYTGKLYVADDTYAITRVDYGYYKKRRGQKFNLRLLLGVKYIENVSEGTMIFEKDSSNLYHPKYIKHVYGSYFYVNRDLKFIENSLKKNKVGFSFKLEGDRRNKEELLFTANNKLTLKAFKNVQQDSIITFQQLDRFEKTIWDNEGILEPSLEMKTFNTD